MPINGRESNAPTNMLPYIRELESELEQMKQQIAVITSALKAQRS